MPIHYGSEGVRISGRIIPASKYGVSYRHRTLGQCQFPCDDRQTAIKTARAIREAGQPAVISAHAIEDMGQGFAIIAEEK